MDEKLDPECIVNDRRVVNFLYKKTDYWWGKILESAIDRNYNFFDFRNQANRRIAYSLFFPQNMN